MKKIILLIILTLFSACSGYKVEKAPQSIYFSIVYDQSDSTLIQRPQSETILELYDFERNREMLAGFKLSSINDKRVGYSVQHVLPSAQSTKKYERKYVHYRDDLIAEFYEDVHNSIELYTNNTKGYVGSVCYERIVSELEFLASQNADKKIMLVYSDLRELSSIYNSYREQLTPDQIASLFGKAFSIKSDLSGIHIYFIFEPHDKQEDQAFLTHVDAYKKLLEPLGATIYVSSSGDISQFYNTFSTK